MKKYLNFIIYIVIVALPSYALVIESSNEGTGGPKKGKITIQNPFQYENFYNGTYIGIIGGMGVVSFSGQGNNDFTYQKNDSAKTSYSAGTDIKGNLSSILPSPKGTSLGMYVGYGYQSPINLYFSGEVSFYFLNPKSSVKGQVITYNRGVLQNEADTDATVTDQREIFAGFRVGYIIRRRFLIYGKLGYRISSFSLDGTVSGIATDLDGVQNEYGPYKVNPTIQLSGISIGAGFEYPIPFRVGFLKFVLRNEVMFSNYFNYTKNTSSDGSSNSSGDQVNSELDMTAKAQSYLFTVGLNVLF